MYKLTTRSRKAEKQFYDVLNSREGIPAKLEKLKIDPRKELDAHKLRGKLEGKWSCSLGSDTRMVHRKSKIFECDRKYKVFIDIRD